MVAVQGTLTLLLSSMVAYGIAKYNFKGRNVIFMSVLLVMMVLPGIQTYIESIREFLSELNLDTQYYRILLKAMGIVLVTQLAVQFCQEMDAPMIARRAEFCGQIALMGVALPVFMTLTRMAVDILR